jgi:hypothetical protein
MNELPGTEPSGAMGNDADRNTQKRGSAAAEPGSLPFEISFPTDYSKDTFDDPSEMGS